MSKGIFVSSKTDWMACATLLAAGMPLDRANTEGPEPEMPEPSAPASLQAAFNSLKWGLV